jgi:hypothetical protein
MSTFRIHPLLGLALALFATAATAATHGTASVRYDHPENFTETREVRAFAPMRADSGYLDTLKAYIEKRAAAMLPPGQRLEIVVTDVDRAGSYLPSAGRPDPVRIVKDSYPPRINLHFRLLDADGKVVREGDRRLVGLGFMYDSPARLSDSDPLRHEKRLIDRWLSRGLARL